MSWWQADAAGYIGCVILEYCAVFVLRRSVRAVGTVGVSVVLLWGESRAKTFRVASLMVPLDVCVCFRFI